MSANESTIVCRLGVFTPEERAREGELLQQQRGAALEVRERSDGYSFRYPSDPAFFVRMAELVTLEHRCCPFLDFRIEWSGAEEHPWLHITGSAQAKAFLAETFCLPETES